ncbi:hypothetical protein BANRA_05385 [Klebsiella pneumoniae]|nr:hypothetical protein BANRA_05385 [Klebsiella pneumoniae]
MRGLSFGDQAFFLVYLIGVCCLIFRLNLMPVHRQTGKYIVIKTFCVVLVRQRAHVNQTKNGTLYPANVQNAVIALLTAF